MRAAVPHHKLAFRICYIYLIRQYTIMADLPQPVLDRLEILKKDHKHRLQIKLIRGGYYVYEEYSRWDSEAKRVRTYTLYVGKIEPSGEFIKPHRKSTKTSGIKNIEGYIRARSAEALDNRRAEEEEQNKKIIRMLSNNARTPLESIAKEVGITRQAVMHRIKQLEERFGIEYTLNIKSRNKFNISKYMLRIKFKDKKPDTEKVRAVLENDPNVQFAAFTKGSFDLVMYLTFTDTYELETWIYKIGKSEPFIKYNARWNVSYIITENIPFRDKFFTEVLSKKVWHRTKEQPRKRPDQIFNREYAVLRALNINGKAHFKDIDKEYGLSKGLAKYTSDQLFSNGVINVTITMRKAPIRYIALINIYQDNMASFERNRKELFLYFLKDNGSLTNRFIASGDIGSPRGFSLIAAIYNNGELERIEGELRSMLKGDTIKSAIITDVITGKLNINRRDYKDSPVYKDLINEYKMSEEEINNSVKYKN